MRGIRDCAPAEFEDDQTLDGGELAAHARFMCSVAAQREPSTLGGVTRQRPAPLMARGRLPDPCGSLGLPVRERDLATGSPAYEQHPSHLDALGDEG